MQYVGICDIKANALLKVCPCIMAISDEVFPQLREIIPLINSAVKDGRSVAAIDPLLGVIIGHLDTLKRERAALKEENAALKCSLLCNAKAFTWPRCSVCKEPGNSIRTCPQKP